MYLYFIDEAFIHTVRWFCCLYFIGCGLEDKRVVTYYGCVRSIRWLVIIAHDGCQELETWMSRWVTTVWVMMGRCGFAIFLIN